MSRVIQDSDDELDDELEVDTHQSEKDASPKHSTSDASSTEALRRQIEAAHRAHLQSQFSVLGGNTSEVHAQKRKLPEDFNSNSATTEDSKTTVATNGMFLGGSSNSMRAHQEPVIDAVPHLSQSANGADWLLDGTMRDAYAAHNPAMFPEPSSTIPNATLTQQRLMNGIRAPASLGSDLEIERPPFQPDASIPWSEYLKSPTDTAEHLKSSTQGVHISQDLLDPGSEPLHNDHSTRSTLHGGSQGSLLLMDGLSTQEAPQTVTDAQDATAISKRELPDNLGHVQSQRRQTSSFATEGPRSSSRQAVKKRRSPSRASASDDDLAELGVPKEQYQPRPSRSRSSRVDTQESIDYSVRPERAARTTRRRKPSPDSSYDQISLSTPDRIRQICEMGFTPSTSARALRKNNGDVTQTVNWLITNRVADDELLSHTSQMSQVEDARSGGDVDKLKTNVNSESPDAIASVGSLKAPGMSVTVLSDMERKSPSGVQVVIPAKSPNPAMNPKQKKATSRTVAPTEVVPEEIKVEKKRGRGRPKKVAKTSHVEDIGLQQSVKQGHRVESTAPSMEKTTQLDSVQSQEDKNLENASIAKSREELQCSESESTMAAVASTKVTPEPAALPDRPQMEPITPERVKKPTHREQLSSNRAKVPYRVGLSKRARIAPLLRTVKK